MGHQIVIVLNSSYGDAVICLSALRKSSGHFFLLIHASLKELLYTLGGDVLSRHTVLVFGRAGGELFPLFNLRRSIKRPHIILAELGELILALLRIRSCLGLRHVRLITFRKRIALIYKIFGFKLNAIQDADFSYYRAWDKALGAQESHVTTRSKVDSSDNATPSVFPDSRLPAKSLPTALISSRIGPSNVYHYMHDYSDVPSLMKLIRSSSSVISADSLPAHLALYFDVPVEVWVKIELFDSRYYPKKAVVRYF